MIENTEAEMEAVRRLIGRQPDSALLSAVLGLDGLDDVTPLCHVHGTAKIRCGDWQGWRCSRCHKGERRATTGRLAG